MSVKSVMLNMFHLQEGALCALDILSACGLVNYFGRQDLPGGAQTEEEMAEQGLQVKPVLLEK